MNSSLSLGPSSGGKTETSAKRASYFLVGPTAAGKSDLAHYLAQKLQLDILSADSMAVYQGMNIGTDKPSYLRQQQVHYWGIDLVSPQEHFSVAAYLDSVGSHLGDQKKGNVDLVSVGGSGLYVQALIRGLFNAPKPDLALRSSAEKLYNNAGLEALQELLLRTQPERYAQLKDKSNPRRLIRALELSMHDVPLHSQNQRKVGPLVGLRIPSLLLLEKIKKRVNRMFEEGLLDEVDGLLKRYGSLSDGALQAIGYKEAMAILRGDLTKEEAKEQIVRRTKRLAKHQYTWFNHQAHMFWIDTSAASHLNTLGDRVLSIWEKHGPIRLAL